MEGRGFAELVFETSKQEKTMTKFGSELPKYLREPQRFARTDPNPAVPFVQETLPLPSPWVALGLVAVALVIGAGAYVWVVA